MFGIMKISVCNFSGLERIPKRSEKGRPEIFFSVLTSSNVWIMEKSYPELLKSGKISKHPEKGGPLTKNNFLKALLGPF